MTNRKLDERQVGSGRLVRYERGYIYSGDDLDNTPPELEFELEASPAEHARLQEQLVREREALHAALGFVDPVRGIVAGFDSFAEYEAWLERRVEQCAREGKRVFL